MVGKPTYQVIPLPWPQPLPLLPLPLYDGPSRASNGSTLDANVPSWTASTRFRQVYTNVHLHSPLIHLCTVGCCALVACTLDSVLIGSLIRSETLRMLTSIPARFTLPSPVLPSWPRWTLRQPSAQSSRYENPLALYHDNQTDTELQRMASNLPMPGPATASPGSTTSNSSTASDPPSRRNTAQSLPLSPRSTLRRRTARQRF